MEAFCDSPDFATGEERDDAPARIIHERFCCNRGFAAATCPSAGGLGARSVDILLKEFFLSTAPRAKTRPAHRLAGVRKRGSTYSSSRGPRFATPHFRDEPS